MHIPKEILNRVPKPFHSDSVYLVGGTVRDLLLKKEIKDIDLVYVGKAKKFLKQHEVQGKVVPLHDEFDEFRIVLENGFWIDFTGIKGKNLWEDLEKRDFTINSIAVSITSGHVVDPTGGLRDLKRKVIKTYKMRNLLDDPLRILRAFRLLSQTGFSIDIQTKKWLTKISSRIVESAPERIHYEFKLLLSGSYVNEALKELEDCDLLQVIFPELAMMATTTQVYNGNEQNLLDHTILVIKKLVELRRGLSDSPLSMISEEISKTLSDDENWTLFLYATLLHDIGKPMVRVVESGNRTRFHGHDLEGERLVNKIGKRLRWSNKEVKTISLLVRNHMYPHHLAWDEHMTDRAIARYLRKMKEWAFPMVLFAVADAFASPPKSIDITNHIKLAERLLDIKNTLEKKKVKRILTGHDLIKLGIPPGPLYKKILDTIQDEYVAGLIKTKEDAIKRVKQLINSS